MQPAEAMVIYDLCCCLWVHGTAAVWVTCTNIEIYENIQGLYYSLKQVDVAGVL